MSSSIDRRTFVKRTAAAGMGLSLAAPFSLANARRAPSDRVVVGVMGVNSRGHVLAEVFAGAAGSEVAYVCDVDSRAAARTAAAISQPTDGRPALQNRKPKTETDVRRMLEDRDLDAIVIAAPDHWHAPASILAMQAGKHVYVEKPCGHNPREGELLVEAQRRYGRVVQMGNQQRSSPESIQIVAAIRDGLIGRPYFGRAWYANTRGPIGRGKPAAIPDWLDYDLWQGPAPRRQYMDNVVHYNWHWFWHWGTGEINNNGTHEIDICRWALGVDYPVRVTSAGGRYHFDDDWEFYDTQVASFDFAGGQTLTWEGRSCNGQPIDGRGRGATIFGEKGSVTLDRDGYVVYDLDRNEIWRRVRPSGESSLDVRGGDSLTDLHADNFLAAIRGEEAPRSPIHEGHRSNLLCHLGNIAQKTGQALNCDPTNGRITGDDEAMRLWSREYEPGWAPSS